MATTSHYFRCWLIAILAFAVAPWSCAFGQSSADGFTEPFRRVDLATTEQGLVAEVFVEEGARVSAGQMVAQLENSALQAAAEVAKAAAANHGRRDAADAEYKLRRRRLDRLQELRAQGNAHQEEVNRAEADLAVALANLQIAAEQQRVDQLESKRADALLERRNVRSPINGFIVAVHRQPGEFVTSSVPAVVTIAQIDKLRVTFALPTAEAKLLATGGQVQVGFPETSASAAATVESVSPVTDPESGTVRVRVLIDNVHGRYSCGVRCVLVPGGRK